MKIAILSDIHGNSVALDAVLADIENQAVDAFWVLGDLVALGPDPVGVLERLAALENCQILRGNTDRYVVTGERPAPFAANLDRNEETIRIFAEVAGTFAWTQGAITAAGWFPWLAQLPLEFRVRLPDGSDCLCVHATPGHDDGEGIDKDLSDAAISRHLEGCPADLVCVGHNHQPIDRQVGRWHVLNPGSVSNPRQPILQASYAILDGRAAGTTFEHRLVDYDREKVIAQTLELNHPGADFIIQHLRGLRH